MFFKCQRVGSDYALSTAFVMLLFVQKMAFLRVTRSVVMCSSFRCGACRWWYDSLSPMVVSSFFFLLLSLFQLKYMLVLFFFLFFNFSPYVFYCLFSSLTLLEMFFNVFNSVFKL